MGYLQKVGHREDRNSYYFPIVHRGRYSKSMFLRQMIRRVKVLLFMLVLSLSFHILVAEIFSFRINAKKYPIIYSWLDILSKSDIRPEKKTASLWEGVSFAANDLGKKYFSSLLLPKDNFYFFEEEKIYPFIPRSNSFKKETAYLYLWEREKTFTSERREDVLYKVFVSPRGKVIFSTPLCLPSDSNAGIQLEEYIRQAVLFLNDNFFWTKVKGVIK